MSDGLGTTNPCSRCFPWLIGACLLLQTTLAAALGLGELRAQSALNQPFYGQIDLLDVSVSELDTVNASLASRSAFEQAGIERPHSLTRLQFTPMIGPRGEPMIQVITREPVREPYLDLLLEVVWPAGRLVKQYTVLLDPPAVDSQRVVRAASRGSRQTGQSPFVAAAEPAGAAPSQAPPATAARASSSASVASSAEPQPIPAQAAVEAEVVVDVEIPPEAVAIDFPLRYGPVPPGAGLAMIARRLTPPVATWEQTALALYRNSQDAFINGDINRLRLGAELVIPTAAELFVLTSQEARQQYRAALAGGPVARAPLTDVEARLSIATLETDELVAVDGETVEEAVVEVETVEELGSPKVELPPSSAALEAELLLMREASEANRQEATELRRRVQELEAQLADIRRLLELRNEQFAQQAAGNGPLIESEAVTLARPSTATEVVTEAAAEDAAETETDGKAEADIEAETEFAAETEIEVDNESGIEAEAGADRMTETGSTAVDLESQGQSEPASEPQAPRQSVVEPGSGAGAAEAQASAPAPAPAATETSLLASLDGWLKAIQGGALPALALGLVLLLIGLLWYRRRQGMAAKQDEAAPVAPTLDTTGDAGSDELRLDPDWSLTAPPQTPTVTSEASVLALDDPIAAEFEPPLPEPPATETELVAGVPAETSATPRSSRASEQPEEREGQAVAGAPGPLDLTESTAASPAPDRSAAPPGDEEPERLDMPEVLEAPEGIEESEAIREPERIKGPEDIREPEGIEGPGGIEVPAVHEVADEPEMPGGLEIPEVVEAPRGLRPAEAADALEITQTTEVAQPSETAEIPEVAERSSAPEDQDAEPEDEDELFLDLDELERMSDRSSSEQAWGDAPAAMRPAHLKTPEPTEASEHLETDDEQRLELDLAALDAMTRGKAADDGSAAAQTEAPATDPGPVTSLSGRAALEPFAVADEASTEAELSELPVLDPFDADPSNEGLSSSPQRADVSARDADETLIAKPVSEHSTEEADAISRPQATDATPIDHGPDHGLTEGAGEPWDDIGLKLDLARAYLDMGDADAASTILKEVVAKGRDEQRREAESLLVGIDA